MYDSLQLPTGKYLKKVIKELPANKIIYKHLTGCGATHLEIFCDRWSIIVEPYIPVILGKQWMKKLDSNDKPMLDKDGNYIMIRNTEVLAIYEKTSVEDVIDFLSIKRNKYKLITTPEGMVKVIKACEVLEINPFDTFFLLVDECEKLIQDANFREDITVVMDYFFQFKNRSFISATPIAPSDPRFATYNFDNFYIIPEDDKKIKIDLYASNNIASTLRKYLYSNKNDHYLIFVNSTERIASLIKFLNIELESQVFCSRESADILKINGIANTSANWDKKKYKKYNFFTSRFFTAFDLEVNGKPNVLIISDFKKVAHSALDPNTDIIQIEGRARNGINHFAHITNWDAKKTQTEIEIKAYIKGLKDGYEMIKQLRDQCRNNASLGIYDVLNEALETCRYNNYLNRRTMDECPYLIDNEIQRNKVVDIYRTSETIYNAYIASKRFDVNPIRDEYNLSDVSIERLKVGISKKETLKIICEMFATYFQQTSEIYNLTPNFTITELIKTHNSIYQYYKSLGIERIRELNYNVKQIEREHKLKEIENSDSFYQLTYTLLLVFKKGSCFTGNKMGAILRHYYAKYGVKLPATVQQLRYWFDIPEKRVTLGRSVDGREIKGYRINGPKNWIVLPKRFRQ